MRFSRIRRAALTGAAAFCIAAAGSLLWTPSSAEAASLCAGTPVPAGEIVVSRYLDPNCPNPPGTLRNAYQTDTPGVGKVACAPTGAFPFPAGYVAVERLTTAACSSGGQGELRNAYRIDTPAPGKVVCAPTGAFPLPAGYTYERILATQCSSGAPGEILNAFRLVAG